MTSHTPTKLDRSNVKRACTRRGISLVIVVLLISLTMAVSFAVIHSQGTAIAIQQNANLRAGARQAAMTGMAVALREASSPDWIGVGASFAKDLSTTERFTVTYSTGDATLSDGDTDYDEYPYRVTIVVTGYSVDPNYSERKASHSIEAVVRLVPQDVEDEPSGWEEIQENTLCQWYQSDELFVSIPCRIEGPVRFRGKLTLCEYNMEWSSSVCSYYLTHLDFMRDSGLPDYRPFNGTITINRSEQDLDTLDLLVNALDLHLHDTDSYRDYSWLLPFCDGSYRLYAGGKTYYAENVSGELRDAHLKPDPKTNPLGLFVSYSDIHFAGNSSLEGILVCDGDVRVISGTSTFKAMKFPPYSHRNVPSDAVIQLPVVVSDDDVVVQTGGSLAMTGLVMTKEKFVVQEDLQNAMAMTISGKVVTKKIYIEPRSEWQKSKDWWNLMWDDYPSKPFPLFFPLWGNFFPSWLKAESNSAIDPEPRIWIKPETQAVRYHWYNGNNPLFQSPSEDEGLTWELIRWTDNP